VHVINVFHLGKHCIAGAMLLRPDLQDPVVVQSWHPPIPPCPSACQEPLKLLCVQAGTIGLQHPS